jgi:hypothetical protein
MEKFYTYVLISFVIFASLSISPTMVQADDGIGPKILDVSFDRTKLTRGQEVELVVNAEDSNGLASSAEIELVTPDGYLKTLNARFYGDNRYRITLDLSRYWEFQSFGTYQIKNVKVIAIHLATPPQRAVGTLWISRSRTDAMAPKRMANFLTKGVIK